VATVWEAYEEAKDAADTRHDRAFFADADALV
jgi:hypothetical protein